MSAWFRCSGCKAPIGSAHRPECSTVKALYDGGISERTNAVQVAGGCPGCGEGYAHDVTYSRACRDWENGQDLSPVEMAVDRSWENFKP
jgi:hypothetical protein